MYNIQHKIYVELRKKGLCYQCKKVKSKDVYCKKCADIRNKKARENLFKTRCYNRIWVEKILPS